MSSTSQVPRSETPTNSRIVILFDQRVAVNKTSDIGVVSARRVSHLHPFRLHVLEQDSAAGSRTRTIRSLPDFEDRSSRTPQEAAWASDGGLFGEESFGLPPAPVEKLQDKEATLRVWLCCCWWATKLPKF